MRVLLTRLLGPLAFRVPARGARLLFAFARAEHGSMLDLRAAARCTGSTARRALYLRHALDEARHAAMLAHRSAEMRRADGRAPLGAPSADFEALFERLGEVAFLAYVHRGELRGARQFEVHRRAAERRGDAKTAALFSAVLEDERRHATYTRELLVALAGGERRARAMLLRSALWEAWRAQRRVGRAIAAVIWAVLAVALYLATAPLAWVVRRARPVRAGWALGGGAREEHPAPAPGAPR